MVIGAFSFIRIYFNEVVSEWLTDTLLQQRWLLLLLSLEKCNASLSTSTPTWTVTDTFSMTCSLIFQCKSSALPIVSNSTILLFFYISLCLTHTIQASRFLFLTHAPSLSYSFSLSYTHAHTRIIGVESGKTFKHWYE